MDMSCHTLINHKMKQNVDFNGKSIHQFQVTNTKCEQQQICTTNRHKNVVRTENFTSLPTAGKSPSHQPSNHNFLKPKKKRREKT